MIKSLIKSTNEVRLENEEDADNFHKEVQEQAEKMGCILSSFTKNLKQKKSKGEIVEEYYQVKYTFVFNDLKDPESCLDSINYEVRPYSANAGVDAEW